MHEKKTRLRTKTRNNRRGLIKMFKPATIIILTKNSENYITQTFKNLLRFQKRHSCIEKIIIADCNSKDQTIPKLMQLLSQAKNKSIIVILQPKFKNEKKILEVAIEASTTDNIILLEPDTSTCLRQVLKQNKKLNKADLIISSRLHKESRTNYKPDPMQLLDHTLNLKKTGYADSLNPQKALKKTKILPLLIQSKDWNELIIKAKTNNLKITETPTNWNKKIQLQT
jgi:glycosyltransferase involved in cell wall biosynthesis